MRNNQDNRRKQPLPNVIKHIPISNNLMAAQDRKRPKSKQKQNQKIPIINSHKTIIPPNVPYQQHDPKNIANGINFRNLKSGITKKCGKEIIRVINQPLSQDQHQGISINVNIQNMISGKNVVKANLSDIKSQRSPSIIKHQKSFEQDSQKIKYKKKKVIDDFQCNEELQLANIKHINANSNNLSAVNTARGQRKVSQKKPLISYTTQKANISTKIQQIQTASQILKVKTTQELKQFEASEQEINIEGQSQMVMTMDFRQQSYFVDPAYIQKKQNYLTWLMRGMLLQWMMHVSSQFSLKRQTFHIALIITDNYLAKILMIPKGQLQLVGATAMFIASKLEEFQPLSSKEFSKSTGQLYSSVHVKEMQTRICKALKFNLNPPTIAMWSNRIMTQWDQYLQVSETAKYHGLFTHQNLSPKFFKKPDQDSYNNFRTVMQLLDCAVLDVQTLQYRPQFLVCSFMYLVLGKQLNSFKTKEIISQFPRSSLYLLDESNWFNDLFKGFLHDSFGFLLLDLLPTVQYSATYFILPIIIDQPILRNQFKDGCQDMNYEEYCSFQTYNSNSLKTIKKRHRDIYQ